jgi:chromosome segregation ATPase
MLIKTIEINSFKNFSGYNKFDVSQSSDDNFIVIIGANGSGKSSIMDAIQWCMFNLSTKDMRCKNTSELLNKEDKLIGITKFSIVIEIENITSSIIISRTYDLSKRPHKPVISAIYNENNESNLISEFEDIKNVLLSYGISMNCIERNVRKN